MSLRPLLRCRLRLRSARRSGAMEGGPRNSGATEGACEADAGSSARPQSQRSHGHPDERILGAGELEEEGTFPLAVHVRPRLKCDIEAITRGRKGVGIHPADGGAHPAGSRDLLLRRIGSNLVRQ